MHDDTAEHADDRAPGRTLLDMLADGWKTQAVYVAAELKIMDVLGEGAMASGQLAVVVGADAPSLHRLLRALTTIDLCRQCDDGRFEITAMGRLLISGSPDSLRSWSIWCGAHLWPVWGELLYSVKTGKSARKKLLDAAGFEQLERNAETAAVFHEAFVELTRLTAQSIIATYDFSSFGTIVDVGGGRGELIASILHAHPTSSGILFDRPHTIDAGIGHIGAAGLADRCQCVAGDFFESIPAEGDAYVLKSVIHDWDDEHAMRILENCRLALGANGRLVLIEQVMPDQLEVLRAHQAIAGSDLTMLAALAAQERTESQMHDLLSSAKFRLTRILPTDGTFSVIEAVPASS